MLALPSVLLRVLFSSIVGTSSGERESQYARPAAVEEILSPQFNFCCFLLHRKYYSGRDFTKIVQCPNSKQGHGPTFYEQTESRKPTP